MISGRVRRAALGGRVLGRGVVRPPLLLSVWPATPLLGRLLARAAALPPGGLLPRPRGLLARLMLAVLPLCVGLLARLAWLSVLALAVLALLAWLTLLGELRLAELLRGLLTVRLSRLSRLTWLCRLRRMPWLARLRAVRLPIGGRLAVTRSLAVGSLLAVRRLLPGRRERRRRLPCVRLLRLSVLRRRRLQAGVGLTGLGLTGLGLTGLGGGAVVLLGRRVRRRGLGLVGRPPHLRRVALLIAGLGDDAGLDSGLVGVPPLLRGACDGLGGLTGVACVLLRRRLVGPAREQVHLAGLALGGLALRWFGRALLGHFARLGRVPPRLRDGTGLLAGPLLTVRLGPPPAGRLLLAPRRLLGGLLRRTVWWLLSLWRTHRGPSPWRHAVARSKHRPRSRHRCGRPRPFTRYPQQPPRGGSSRSPWPRPGRPRFRARPPRRSGRAGPAPAGTSARSLPRRAPPRSARRL